MRDLKGRKKMFAKIRKMLKLWPELWALPFGIAAWLLSPIIIHAIDPEAGSFDTVGTLQIILIAGLLVSAFSTLAFVGIKLNWPTLFRYYAGTLKEGISSKLDFKELTPWQRVKVLLGLYLGLLFVLALLAAQIL